MYSHRFENMVNLLSETEKCTADKHRIKRKFEFMEVPFIWCMLTFMIK